MSPSDEELIAMAVGLRDARAFGVLVERHQGVVRGLLTRLTGNRAMAEDLAQEAFLRAYRKLSTFSGTGSFRGWLCRIATTEFLMARRKRLAAERALEKVRANTEDEEAAAAAASWDRGDAMDLDRALAQLPENERLCVTLCYACGMSHGEAAEATGLPLGTVKSHVNRGRAKLKALLSASAPVAVQAPDGATT